MCPKQSFKLSLRFNSNKKCEHRVLKKWQQLKNTLEEVEIFMSCSIVADESPNVTNTIWLAIFVCVQSSRNVLEGTQPRLRLDGMEENGKFWRLGIESDAT